MMHDVLPLLLKSDFPTLQRKELHIVQVVLESDYNQHGLTDSHDSEVDYKDTMSPVTADILLSYLQKTSAKVIEIIGGVSDAHSQFRFLVSEARKLGMQVVVRFNLLRLQDIQQTEFLAENQANVNAVLPDLVFDENGSTIQSDSYTQTMSSLSSLNAAGFGQTNSKLKLNLLYIPAEPIFPQLLNLLENKYINLLANHGIAYNEIISLTHMPIQYFGSRLLKEKRFDDYINLLKLSFNETNLDVVPCRYTVSIDWQGYVYDCFYNLLLGVGIRQNEKSRIHLKLILNHDLLNMPITTGQHCYGCRLKYNSVPV